MATVKDYGHYETAWCPGCGNFGILKALKKALAESGLEPHQVLLVSGIGQAAKEPHYLNVNMLNGLHGRSLPAAVAAKLANRDLTVIADSGDGCHYGEGGNHYIHAVRRNPDVTMLVHDNQVYGLTKGQASPTSQRGFKNKVQPMGAPSEPMPALALAVVMGAGFVARGLAIEIDHLASLILQAVRFKGFSVLDVLQPCPSFNHVNTAKWYKEHTYQLPESHDPYDFRAALEKSLEWESGIPLGVIYKNDRPVFEDSFPALKNGPLANREIDARALQQILDGYR